MQIAIFESHSNLGGLKLSLIYAYKRFIYAKTMMNNQSSDECYAHLKVPIGCS